MNDLLARLLGATLGLSLSALAVQALVAVLRPSSPKVQQAAWFLVLFQGLVLFHLPVRLPWYEPSAVRGSPDSAHVPTAGLQETGGDLRSNDGGVGRPAPSANFGDAESPIPEPEGPAQLHWQWIAWALWLGGMALLAIFSGLAYVLFLRRLSFGQPGHQEWADQWQRLLEERGISRSIALVITEGIGPALYWTPRGYRVCVPRLSWATLTAGQRLAILRHELAHFERSDLWVLLLARLLALPHWFNPFAWWAVHQSAQCAEWACDQTAAGAKRHEAVEYAKALLELGVARSRGLCAARPARGSSLSIRIRRLTRFTSPEDSIVKKASLLALAAGMVAASVVRVELLAKEPAADPPAAESAGLRPAESAANDKSTAIGSAAAGPAGNAISEDSSKSARRYVVEDVLSTIQQDQDLDLPHSKELLQGWLNAPWRDPGDRSSSTGPEKGATAPARSPIDQRSKPSGMTWSGDNLVVETTEAGHRQIANSLESIRKHGAASVRIRTLFMTAAPETLDQAGVKWTVLSSDYPKDSAADQGLSPPFRPLGGSQESPSNWSRLVIEKIQPMMLEIVDEDRGARLLEQWQKEPKVNVVRAPTIAVLSGQWAMASDVSQSPFVVGLKAVGLNELQPQIRVVSEGTVLQLRPLVDRQGKLRLDFVAAFSRIRSVDTFPVRSDTIIQVPEVETTRVQSTVDLPLRSWLLLRGPQRNIECEATPSWSNWLSVLGVPRKPARAKQEELLVMVHVEKASPRPRTGSQGGDTTGNSDSSASPDGGRVARPEARRRAR